MRKRTKIGLVISSAAAILLAGSIMAGGTYALFTSESKTNIAVNSGTVSVTATVDGLTTYSGETNSLTGDVAADSSHIKSSTELGITDCTFLNGGTASFADKTLTLKNMTPGDKVEFNIKVTNGSNVSAKYRTIVAKGSDDGLYSGLEIKVDNEELIGTKSISSYKALGNEVISIPVVVNLPSDRGNEYQGKTCDLVFSVEAIQGNASDGVYEVTPTNAQETIDNLKGDATIVLTAGNYDTLYLRQDLDTSTRRTDLDVDNSYPAYYREFKNLTIKAKEGETVSCDQIKVEAGLFWYDTAPASNQNEMNRANSGFISYLSLENIVIDGIKFDDTTKNAVILRDNASNRSKGSTLYTDNLVINNCEGTGDSSNTNIHFLSMGSGATDENFVGTGKKGLNNIYLTNNAIKDYYQPICCNNNVATLNNFIVKDNKFVNPLDNVIQLSNKVNEGEFIFDGNTLTNMKGRFVRLANGSATLNVSIRNTTIQSPASYDEDVEYPGQIFKVTGASGFKVNCYEKSWSVITNTDTSWVAKGDMSLLPTT